MIKQREKKYISLKANKKYSYVSRTESIFLLNSKGANVSLKKRKTQKDTKGRKTRLYQSTMISVVSLC